MVLLKQRWIEDRNSKNGEIGMFANCFFIDLNGFSGHSFTWKYSKWCQITRKLMIFAYIGWWNSYFLISETAWFSSEITMDHNVSIKPCVHNDSSWRSVSLAEYWLYPRCTQGKTETIHESTTYYVIRYVRKELSQKRHTYIFLYKRQVVLLWRKLAFILSQCCMIY